MSDDTMNPAHKSEVVDPTEVSEPAPGDRLIDGAKVIMIVGDERQAVPMALPDVFQQMFAILGDLDRRLMALEEKKQKSSIVTIN